MSDQPKIIHLDLLDTDYVRLAVGEPIEKSRLDRLDISEGSAVRYLCRQIARYRYGSSDQEGRDDALYNIGSYVGLLTPADVEDIHERLRQTGRLFLTTDERQQILNWLSDELAVTLSE